MANSAFEHTPSFSTPGSSTNDSIVRWDGTTGSAIQNSTKVTIDDNGTMGVPITQSSHGFSVGDVLKSSGSNGAYAKAQADSAANAEMVGIVIAVADTNNFTLSVSSRISVAAAVPDETAGTVLFLSPSSAGALQTAEPSTAGQISKPVAVVTTANSEMILLNYRGESISTGYNNWDVNGTELILDVDGDTSITADTDDQIDVKISGADDFRFTANNFNVLSGSTITIDSGATITNSGTANGFGGGPSQATQAALEAATNEDTYAPPDLMHHHPGMIKVWGIIGGGGDLKSLDYNVASVTDTGTGDRMIIFTTAFSSNLYCSTAAMTSADTNQVQIFMEYLGSASQIRHRCYSGNNAAMSLYDAAASFQITGDQS